MLPGILARGISRWIRGCIQGMPGAFVQIKAELEPACLMARFLE